MALRVLTLLLVLTFAAQSQVLGARGNSSGPLSPNGRELAMVRPGGRLLVVNVVRGGVRYDVCPRRDAQARSPGIDSLAWSPDGARLAVLFDDGLVLVLEAASGEVLCELPTQPKAPGVRAWVRRSTLWVDGERLLVTHGNVPTELWSVERAERLLSIESPGGVVTAVAQSDDRELLAMGDEGGFVGVWQMPGGELVGRLPPQATRVYALDIDAPCTRLALGTGTCIASVWSLADSRELGRYSHQDEDVFGSLVIGGVGFSPDGRGLVTTSSSFWEARPWNLKDGRELWRYGYNGGNAGRLSAQFVEGGRRVLLGLHGVIVDSDTGKVVNTLVPGNDVYSFVGCGAELAWFGDVDVLRVWSLDEEGQPFRDIALPD